MRGVLLSRRRRGQHARTGYDCSAPGPRPQIQITGDHFRTVFHDTQTHSTAVKCGRIKSGAVVLNSHGDLPTPRPCKPDTHVAGSPMLDGVIKCFLCDAIEMDRRGRVSEVNLAHRFEPALRAVDLTRPLRQLSKRRR